MLNFPFQVVRHCDDIQEELNRLCRQLKININDVDFELLSVEVLMSKNEKREHKAFSVITQEEFWQLEDEEIYNQDNFKIKQRYDIRIKPKEKIRFIELKTTDFGDSMSLVFKEGLTLLNTESFYYELFEEIESLMAYKGVFIRRKDEIKQTLKTQIQKVLLEQIPLPYEFVLLESKVYRPYQKAHCDFLPIQSRSDQHKKHKGAYFAVNKGEDVVRFVKSKPSRSGRNLFGEYIDEAKSGVLSKESLPKFRTDEIEKIDYGDEVVFRSLIDSYVSLKDEEIIFYRQNEFAHIDTMNTPPLLGGMEKNITLNIVASDLTQEAIKSGVVLEASKISITGNIGANVRIQANEIEIKGSTHPDSDIIANHANIETHCGNLMADSAEIKVLDKGFVQTENLSVECCKNGNILSKEARIKKVENNNNIAISYRLYLGDIQGNNNVITISSSAYHETKNMIDVLVNKRNFLVSNAKEVYVKYHQILKAVKKNKALISRIDSAQDLVREKMLQNKNIAEAYGNYHQMIKDLRILKQELFEYQQVIEKTISNLVSIDEEILNAQIYCDESWGENTELVYRREFPQKQIKSLKVDKDFRGSYRIDSKAEDFIGMHR